MELITQIILSFVLFAVIGYVCEVIYCSIYDHKLVNRGFLFGPWLPIYGCGGLIIQYCLVPLHSHPILVFLLGMILTSTVEYIGSWMLEKLFHIKLWDYSHYRFHINGRVCLLNSTLFGIMGLVLVYGLEPYMAMLINLIPISYRDIVALVLANLFTVDVTLSVVQMKAFQNAMEEAVEKAREMDARVKYFVSQGKHELAAEIKERLTTELEASKEKGRRRFQRIVDAFPSATTKQKELKEQIRNYQHWMFERKLATLELKSQIKSSVEEYREKVDGINARARERKND